MLNHELKQIILSGTRIEKRGEMRGFLDRFPPNSDYCDGNYGECDQYGKITIDPAAQDYNPVDIARTYCHEVVHALQVGRCEMKHDAAFAKECAAFTKRLVCDITDEHMQYNVSEEPKTHVGFLRDVRQQAEKAADADADAYDPAAAFDQVAAKNEGEALYLVFVSFIVAMLAIAGIWLATTKPDWLMSYLTNPDAQFITGFVIAAIAILRFLKAD
jgi:hypothetical protein